MYEMLQVLSQSNILRGFKFSSLCRRSNWLFLQTGLFATAVSDCIITVTELEKILTLEKADLNYSLSQVVPSWIAVLNRKRSLAMWRTWMSSHSAVFLT